MERLTLGPGFAPDIHHDRRYQVVVWCEECGEDEKQDFATLKEARKEVRSLLLDGWETAAIYDYRTRRVVEYYNCDSWWPRPEFNPDVMARSTPRYLTAPTDTASRHQLTIAG